MKTVSHELNSKNMHRKIGEKYSLAIKVLIIQATAGITIILFAASVLAQSGMGKSEVPVPDYMRVCKADNDCTYVETLCSSCCGYVGINKKFKKIFYDQNYTNFCSGYKGPVCDCISYLTVPVCRKGVCELIEDIQKKNF